MSTSLIRPRHLCILAALALAGVQLHAQGTTTTTTTSTTSVITPAAAAGPSVGDMAPDFTASMADSAGARSTPVTLHNLRGQVVVVAFYPKDRTSGCTAEMTKFRDEYPTLFGSGVTLLPVSLDSMDSHVGWAHDMHFPFSLVSDVGGQIATSYGSITPGKSYSNRTVYVIGKDGKIVYRDMHFGALDQHAYDALAQAIATARSA